MRFDYGQAPFRTVWETTRACSLACLHCRAGALVERDANELSTEEGKRILADLGALGTQVIVLSGGDCLARPDLEELVEHGARIGIHMTAQPAATPAVTPQRLIALADAGLQEVGFGLDGPTAAVHDSMRRVEGSFDLTLAALSAAHEAGLPAEVHTCVSEWNYRHLEPMIGLVETLGVKAWEFSFLVPSGRGTQLRPITAQAFEEAFERIQRLSAEAPFFVRVSEAPHYWRFVREKELASGMPAPRRPAHGADADSPDEPVNAGKGLVFIDHVGNICPSEFLPLASGNVRTHPLAEIYRDAHPFKELRDPARLKGRCGVCEYARECGGSRARAWAVTGDLLETDPFCAYTPRALRAAPQAANG